MTSAADRLALFAMGALSSKQLVDEIMAAELAANDQWDRREKASPAQHSKGSPPVDTEEAPFAESSCKSGPGVTPGLSLPHVTQIAELGDALASNLHNLTPERLREAMRLAYELGRVDGGMELADKMMNANRKEAS